MVVDTVVPLVVEVEVPPVNVTPLFFVVVTPPLVDVVLVAVDSAATVQVFVPIFVHTRLTSPELLAGLEMS